MVGKELQEQILRLPPEDRAELAKLLLASLDEGVEEDSEQAWLDEAERRSEAHEQGRIEARAAEDAIRQARAKIQ